MSQKPFADTTIREFLDALGGPSPTPGGGTGAAVAGALGASLVRMFAALTIGKPKYAAHDALMRAVADQAKEAAERFLSLAQEDAGAYDAVSAAYRLPKGTPQEVAARKAAIQGALKMACLVPLHVMEQALETIGLAKMAVPVGNRNAASDGAAGAELAHAAMTVASYNVRINLASIDDETFAKDMRTRLDEISYMGTASKNEIASAVLEAWKPPPAPPPPMFPGGPRPAAKT
jgi:formiminotetrahydrofolate cyclodeaminase